MMVGSSRLARPVMLFLRVTMALTYCLNRDLVAGLEKKALCCTPAGGGGGEAGRMWEGCAGGSVWRSLLPGRQQQGERAGRWPEQAQHATHL